MLSGGELFGVEEIVVLEWVHILIEFKDEWACCWNVVSDNLWFTHACKVFDYCSQGVSVGNDDDVLAIKHRWAYGIVPEREDSINSDFKRFSTWKCSNRQLLILWCILWMPFIIKFQGWWWNIIASSPLQHELFSMLGRRFSFIEALKRTIVSFIQPPCFVMRDPPDVQFLRYGVVCVDCSLKDGGIRDIEIVTLFLKQLSCFLSLGHTML